MSELCHQHRIAKSKIKADKQPQKQRHHESRLVLKPQILPRPTAAPDAAKIKPSGEANDSRFAIHLFFYFCRQFKWIKLLLRIVAVAMH